MSHAKAGAKHNFGPKNAKRGRRLRGNGLLEGGDAKKIRKELRRAKKVRRRAQLEAKILRAEAQLDAARMRAWLASQPPEAPSGDVYAIRDSAG